MGMVGGWPPRVTGLAGVFSSAPSIAMNHASHNPVSAPQCHNNFVASSRSRNLGTDAAV